jgi:hypothetical protein
MRGRIKDMTRYFVRPQLTREVFDELRKGVSLSIVGEPQTGKSSLLWYIAQTGPQRLSRAGSDFVGFSLELIHSEDEFFEELCSQLGVPPSRGMKLVRALRGRKVVLCLDEGEGLLGQGFTLNVRRELRGLADEASAPLTLVIASRSPLGRLFPDSPELTSPLAGLCTQLNVQPFTLDEARALAQHYLIGTNITLPDTEIAAAWQRSQGHPAQLQQALKEVFDRHSQ